MKNTTLLTDIVKEINEKGKGVYKAKSTPKGRVLLAYTKDTYLEAYELEDKFNQVIDHLVCKFNVDFEVNDYYKNTILYDVIEY